MYRKKNSITKTFLAYGSHAKFGNKKVTHAGYSFASKLEAAVYDMLKYQQMASEIQVLQNQVSVYLTLAKIQYIADFHCLDQKTNETFYVEAKGMDTPVWRIKRRLWQSYGPAPLHIYKGSYRSPFLHEVITPKSHGEEE